MDALVGALDALCAVDPASLGDGETVVMLHRQLERLGAVVTRAVASFDAGRSWEADGAQVASAWLAVRCGVSRESARRRVRLGRDLRHMAVVEAAWLAGDVGEAQVRLLASARTAETAGCFERDEAMLVDQATTLGYRSFVRALAYWSQLADPDGCERSAQRQHADRRLHLSKTFDGAWVLSGAFDPINGQIVANALGRIEAELFEADWAEARRRVGEGMGDGVGAGDLARTPAQRRADALVVMAQRALAAPAGARLPEPLFSVLVDYDTFARTCELADASVVTPGSLTHWLGTAWVERVVFDGPDRIRNVGVRRRLFSGATRRSIELRDRQCFHDFCEVPAEACQIDHVKPWSEGGLTVEDNGRPACAFHNRERARQPSERQPPERGRPPP